MCNIWKTSREVADLPIEDWIHLFSATFFSDLRELDVTGGEPYLRQDLLGFIERVSHLKDENLKAMRSVAITTNGFLTLRILEYTPKMLELLLPRKVDLVIVCRIWGRFSYSVTITDRYRLFLIYSLSGYERLRIFSAVAKLPLLSNTHRQIF